MAWATGKGTFETVSGALDLRLAIMLTLKIRNAPRIR
jgi:hypothetical protein